VGCYRIQILKEDPMDLINKITLNNSNESYSDFSKKPWVSPTLTNIPFSSTENNLSGSGDGDAAQANFS